MCIRDSLYSVLFFLLWPLLFLVFVWRYGLRRTLRGLPERFGLGGAFSVRGYEERELAGATGVLSTLELGGPELLPLFGVEGQASSLRAFAFADAGRVSNQRDAPCDGERSRCSAASLGAGLQYVRPGVQGRFAVGAALKDGVTTERGDARVHFQLNLDF